MGNKPVSPKRTKAEATPVPQPVDGDAAQTTGSGGSGSGGGRAAASTGTLKDDAVRPAVPSLPVSSIATGAGTPLAARSTGSGSASGSGSSSGTGAGTGPPDTHTSFSLSLSLPQSTATSTSADVAAPAIDEACEALANTAALAPVVPPVNEADEPEPAAEAAAEAEASPAVPTVAVPTGSVETSAETSVEAAADATATATADAPAADAAAPNSAPAVIPDAAAADAPSGFAAPASVPPATASATAASPDAAQIAAHPAPRATHAKRPLPALNLSNVRQLAADNSVPMATARGNYGGATVRLPAMDEGIVMTEQHEKEARLMALTNVCSPITPWLYVSGDKVSSNVDKLRAHGITAVVNCAASVCPSPFSADGIQYYSIPLMDSPDEEAVPYFYTVVEVIDTVRAAGGRVLVHCHQGVSRSGTCAIAYLMWAFGLTWEDGQTLARAGRPILSPNPGFLCQLMEWQTELETLTSAGVSAAALPSPRVAVSDGGMTAREEGAGAGAGAGAGTGAGAGAGAGGEATSAPSAVPQPVLLQVFSLAGMAAWASSKLYSQLPSVAAAGSSSRIDADDNVQLRYKVQVVRQPDGRRPVVPTATSLQSDGCFIVRAPEAADGTDAVGSPHRERVYIWVGSNVPRDQVDAMLQTATTEVARWALLPPAAPRRSGVPKQADELPAPAAALPALPASCKPHVMRQRLNDAPLLELLGPGDATAASGSVDATAHPDASPAPAPDDGMPPLLARLGADDDDDNDGDDGASDDGDTRSRPTLHQYQGESSGWEVVGVYDSDDLDEDGFFVLLPPRGASAATVYAWTGADFTGLDEAAVKAAAGVLACAQGATVSEDPDAVQLAPSGSEPPEFWTLFEQGW